MVEMVNFEKGTEIIPSEVYWVPDRDVIGGELIHQHFPTYGGGGTAGHVGIDYPLRFGPKGRFRILEVKARPKVVQTLYDLLGVKPRAAIVEVIYDHIPRGSEAPHGLICRIPLRKLYKWARDTSSSAT